MKSFDRSAAARGSLYSGGTDADRMTFASNLATQALGNYRGGLQALSGTGQSTAQNLGALGANMASNIGNLYGDIGQARAQGALGRASAYSNLATGLGQLYGWARQRGGGG